MPFVFNAPLTLVGGGAVGDDAFELSQTVTKYFVGVDGGGDEILRRGLLPEAVIGDLDSFSKAGRAAIPADRVHLVSEQESTDFEKALSRVSAPLVLALGFTGARIDHELAVLHVLVRFPETPTVVVGEDDVIVSLPKNITLDLPSGTRVSLFPLDEVAVGMEGLKWSFERLVLHPARKIGTSNRAVGGLVRLRADRPGCLLILPVDALDAVIEALSEADFHSPPG